MKKIFVCLGFIFALSSCATLQSINTSYADEVAYYSAKLTTTTIETVQQSALAAEAVKNGKTDSAIIYGLNAEQLVQQGLIYKDSLLYFIDKSKEPK